MAKFWTNPFSKFKEKLIAETREKKELNELDKREIDRINSKIAYMPKYTDQSTLVDHSIFYEELNHRLAVNNGTINEYIKSKKIPENETDNDNLQADEDLLRHLEELYKDYVDTDNK